MQGRVVDTIRIFLVQWHPTGVEHVLVHGGTQGLFAIAPAHMIGLVAAGTNLLSKLGRGRQHGRASLDVVVRAGIVAKVKVIRNVDDNRVSNLQISCRVPPMLKPGRILVVNGALLQSLLKGLRLRWKLLDGLEQGFPFFVSFSQWNGRWEKAFQSILNGRHWQSRKIGLFFIQGATNVLFQPSILTEITRRFHALDSPWFEEVMFFLCCWECRRIRSIGV
mmetsp:Transcript_27060/g.63375  ORF Transcript_27060/g.63375 Transcript_27060/m.63375 type:complete len:221 (+) Transcript_27060:1219-1881(+)